jgi:hypothetical protein
MAGEKHNASGDYSFFDRLLHRMAFASPIVQRALGEIESDIFAARFASQTAQNPVFVTGLPRAGTTLLLELLYKTGAFSTFTYREMPFVLAPLFWASISKSGRKAGELRERAHGDGMEISFDSPEAFEEVVWLSYLRDTYVRGDRLLPLAPDNLTAEFREAFVKLVRKLAAAQSVDGASNRYLSKNNANISRIDALRSIFPDASIFVCYRDPASHVRSLMTQHQRFLKMHGDDEFSRSYMGWIGHYDFGANFRPIDFAGREVSQGGMQTTNFWLQYWIDAYTFAFNHAGDGVMFVGYENLLDNPKAARSEIAKAAHLEDEAILAMGELVIRKPTTTNADLSDADPILVAEAADLYQRLARRAVAS